MVNSVLTVLVLGQDGATNASTYRPQLRRRRATQSLRQQQSARTTGNLTVSILAVAPATGMARPRRSATRRGGCDRAQQACSGGRCLGALRDLLRSPLSGDVRNGTLSSRMDPTAASAKRPRGSNRCRSTKTPGDPGQARTYDLPLRTQRSTEVKQSAFRQVRGLPPFTNH
jgi:hypothetical protein